MAASSESCTLYIPQDIKLAVIAAESFYAKLPTDATVPLPEGPGEFIDLGCLGAFSQTGDRTFKDVRCLGKDAIIRKVLQSSTTQIQTSLKCMSPETLRFIVGGGTYSNVSATATSTRFFPGTAKGQPPLVGIALEFVFDCVQNGDVIDLLRLRISYPCAQITSSFNFDLGQEGAPSEMVVPVTLEILDAPIDAIHNPDGQSYFLDSNDPNWVAAVAA